MKFHSSVFRCRWDDAFGSHIVYFFILAIRFKCHLLSRWLLTLYWMHINSCCRQYNARVNCDVFVAFEETDDLLIKLDLWTYACVKKYNFFLTLHLKSCTSCGTKHFWTLTDQLIVFNWTSEIHGNGAWFQVCGNWFGNGYHY